MCDKEGRRVGAPTGQVVCDNEGRRVGALTGRVVCDNEGHHVGVLTGPVVCDNEGRRVGALTGWVVCDNEGRSVGALTGPVVCDNEGRRVGALTGWVVCDNEGRPVGALLGLVLQRLRAVCVCMYVNLFPSQTNIVPYTNIKQKIHTQTLNANFRRVRRVIPYNILLVRQNHFKARTYWYCRPFRHSVSTQIYIFEADREGRRKNF